MNESLLLPRKKPRQTRSAQMVDDILKGAIRVLKQQGGRHFTTIRVARETGISVGSIYQYFPNKESILFQVQRREWAETSGIVLALLDDRRQPPGERLRRMIEAFFQSELEEVSLRKALAETGVNLNETEYFLEITNRVHSKVAEFLMEMTPKMSPGQRLFLAKFIFTTIGSIAEEVTIRPLSMGEVRQWAACTADMVLAYLANPAPRAGRRGRKPAGSGAI